LENYGSDEIFFWRNIKKVEVDFVIPKIKIAYEVKQKREQGVLETV
jgi:predicted AAA+ superfamily ATPase